MSAMMNKRTVLHTEIIHICSQVKLHITYYIENDSKYQDLMVDQKLIFWSDAFSTEINLHEVPINPELLIDMTSTISKAGIIANRKWLALESELRSRKEEEHGKT